MDEGKPKTYLDTLSDDAGALARRFGLAGKELEALQKFVVDTAVRSWRNGRTAGYDHATKQSMPR